jgi:hypothetical protein
MGELIDDSRLYELLGSFRHSAYHLEQQAHYAADLDQYRVWLAGDRTPLPELWPGFRDWCDLVRSHTVAGRRVERVRILDEPPTPYQQWELWGGRWNTTAGEIIRYLARRTATDIGLIPAVGPDDFWLLDNRRLITLAWDTDGSRGPTRLVTDPDRVTAARKWWAIAAEHGRMQQDSGFAVG